MPTKSISSHRQRCISPITEEILRNAELRQDRSTVPVNSVQTVRSCNCRFSLVDENPKYFRSLFRLIAVVINTDILLLYGIGSNERL